MSTAAPSGRGTRPGRLDPTVRGLLRAFLSEGVADRYASALQPVAAADRDAALAGAVTTLRARFYVPSDELAVVLVEDTGWAVADVATMLGMPTLEIRAALREAREGAAPRIGAAPPDDLGPSEVAMVEAMLAQESHSRRDDRDDDGDEQDDVDVELRSTLPAHPGLPSLEERVRRADRAQTLAVNLVLVGILAGLVVATLATRDLVEDADSVVADPDSVATGSAAPSTPTSPPTTAPSPSSPAVPSPSPSPSPSPTGPAVASGAVDVGGTRFVDGVDPANGDPGATITTASVDSDPRLWFRLAQLPADELLLEATFTAPSGRTTLRPVLVTRSTPQVSLRLPDELGRDPGRYAARVEVERDGQIVGTAEVELVTPTDG